MLLVLARFFEHGCWSLPLQQGLEDQSLSAEDQLFVLMQAGLYLTATRGLASPDARVCCQRAETLSRLLDRPLALFYALTGLWRYSLMTDKLSATMQIAKRIYALAQDQHDSSLIIGAHRTLAITSYHLGDFETARQNTTRGVQVWRLGGVQSHVEEIAAPAVTCLVFEALSRWHFGEIASSQAAMAEAISLARELNDLQALGQALWFAGFLGQFERNPAKVERLASEVIELSTRQNFAGWSPGGVILRGWAHSLSGNTTEGISWIEHGIADYRAAGWLLHLPYWLALKAEALHLADCTSEALDAMIEAEADVERREERWWSAELHRLRGVFLAATGAEETQIEASFGEAIRIAREQKSVSLEKRAEATYAEYHRQKASGSGGCGFRLPSLMISCSFLAVRSTGEANLNQQVGSDRELWRYIIACRRVLAARSKSAMGGGMARKTRPNK